MSHLPTKTALIIEDDTLLAEHCQNILKMNGWQTLSAASGGDGLKILRRKPPEVLLLDIFLTDSYGLDILKTINEEQIPIVVVIMTGRGSVDLAVEAMRLGAYDFFEKPVLTERLLTTMSNALQHKIISRQLSDYENSAKRHKLHEIIGASLPMQTMYKIIESVANSRANIFITGESGTGKELCAKAIHKQSSRSDSPFVVINCAAIPHDLMESEIFGHVKGAFSDAKHERQGAAAMANGGTLFLDEICDMELGLQSKLLRFIQSGYIKKVGSDLEEQVDCRFICATNKDPKEQIENGSFREDLFYRLHVIPITVPPLRERGEDVLLLAHKFLTDSAKEEKKRFNGISRDAAHTLLAYDWPGNVRELQNIIQQTVVLNNKKKLTREILPPHLCQIESNPKPVLNNSSRIKPMHQVEMEAIEEAIAKCDGNIKLAATLLEIDQSTIYRKYKKMKKTI
ncbi:MAG: sigma-54-dependent Fis family transcriptional regulator [Magnetococcales bacterium]|nr:sigma-54-dependent Fis family transcriptional regulator [Magnetococcales bacterium]